MHVFWSFVYFYVAIVEPGPLLLRPFIGLLYLPWIIGGNDLGDVSGKNDWRGKSRYSEKTCRSAALSTTDPT
jgi:hypothetical protein